MSAPTSQGALPITPEAWPASRGRQVLLVGPNPAMDRIHTVDLLTPGSVHRSSSISARAGGKSSIVGRTLRRLGAEVAMYGFIGGPIAQPLILEYQELGIEDRHTKVSGETRVTTVVVETSSGRSTVLNEPGPQISKSDISNFEDVLFGDIRSGDLVVCTGSLPQGVDDDCYGRISRVALERGAFAAIDASGAALTRSLESAPWCVKCNRQEFTQALGVPDGIDEATLIDLMRAQTGRGSSIVIVTMGGSDFLVVTVNGVWRVTVPEIEVVNATGSGDTFFGSFIAAIWHGDGLHGALQDGTAGGVVNALQLEAGLRAGASLNPYRTQVSFTALTVEGLTR